MAMEDAVALVFTKCCLGTKDAVLAWGFGLDQRRVGEAFKAAILLVNYFFEQTVAQLPDADQVWWWLQRGRSAALHCAVHAA